MLKKISLFLTVLILLCGCSSSKIKNENVVESEYFSDKFSVSIGEDYFNSFLSQVGDIGGEHKIKFSKFFKIVNVEENIKWKLKNLKLDIEEDETTLYGITIIESNGETVETAFKSKVDMTYNNDEEKLKFKPKEIRIKKLANFDITNFYTPVFEIKVANPLNKNFKFKMPDNSYETVSIDTDIVS